MAKCKKSFRGYKITGLTEYEFRCIRLAASICSNTQTTSKEEFKKRMGEVGEDALRILRDMMFSLE